MPACPCRRSSSSRSTALAARLLCAAALTCTAVLVRDHSPHTDLVCLREILFPLHPQHCGTFTGSKGTVRAQFEPPNFITDSRLLSYTLPLSILIFPFFFSSVQCSFPFYFQRNEQSLSESPSYCSGGNPMDLTTEVSVQQQTRAWPWCLPGCPPPSFSSPDAFT